MFLDFYFGHFWRKELPLMKNVSLGPERKKNRRFIARLGSSLVSRFKSTRFDILHDPFFSPAENCITLNFPLRKISRRSSFNDSRDVAKRKCLMKKRIKTYIILRYLAVITLNAVVQNGHCNSLPCDSLPPQDADVQVVASKIQLH